jgi:ABC-type nitrate/sulfonate/bicarbonate transport system substrate-binding protein
MRAFRSLRLTICAAAIAAFALGEPHPAAAQAQNLTKLKIVVFDFPSLGAFMPPVIKAKKFDEANGLDLTFDDRPPTAYTTQFNSGEYKIGGSAALLTVGLADLRGVKVKYLFNLFDYWGGVVTSRPAIKTVKDLEGKELAAARATTNYQMFEFFAKKLGADVSKFKVVNTATPGLVGYAMADRADAVQLWEPAYTILKAKKPDIRLLDLQLDKTWKSFAGGSTIPYLGIAAHTDWIEQNPEAVKKLYATYKAAADYIVKSPEEAAKIIDPKGTPDEQAAVVTLIKANERLGMNVKSAGEMKNEIEAVYKAGMDVGYLKSMPSDDTIYDKPLQ